MGSEERRVEDEPGVYHYRYIECIDLLTYLPSMVLGWAVKSAGSRMNRVLSTTKVIRSSLADVTAIFAEVAGDDMESDSLSLLS